MIYIYINIMLAFYIKNKIFTFKSCVNFNIASVKIEIQQIIQYIPFQPSKVF